LKDQSLTNVFGEHKENLSNNEVGVLTIENQNCAYLPKHIDQHLPNLYQLDIKNSALIEITSADLKMFPNLKNLYIRENLIESLTPGLFAFNQKLQFVNFNDNKIKRIAEGIFDSVPEILSISIERNGCINYSAYGDDEINRLKELIKNCK
jgi:Leucine-rich repeat (LRR) protein